MNSRIMYIELKGDGLNGPGRMVASLFRSRAGLFTIVVVRYCRVMAQGSNATSSTLAAGKGIGSLAANATDKIDFIQERLKLTKTFANNTGPPFAGSRKMSISE